MTSIGSSDGAMKVSIARTSFAKSMAFALCISGFAAEAVAQTPPVPAQPPGVPENGSPPSESTTPPAYPGRDTTETEKPLSDELKQNDGVLEPPKGVDSDIVREAPVPEPNTTPVIPPPEGPAGEPNAQPK